MTEIRNLTGSASGSEPPYGSAAIGLGQPEEPPLLPALNGPWPRFTPSSATRDFPDFRRCCANGGFLSLSKRSFLPVTETYGFWRYASSGTTASTSISTNHSGFTNRLISMIVSTGRASTQYFFLASMASFQLLISVRMTLVLTMS